MPGRICVFFIDDYQAVRKGEIGSSSFIRMQAEQMGCTVYEYNLESQFRNGDYIRPWNADENTKGMRRGIPKSHLHMGAFVWTVGSYVAQYDLRTR
ncbi:DNA/RNA helicase domain-containing protein [Sphingobacterium haloxyli]|uniref:Schlafen group 3-like DNA/RNA helicase domain-containing protein n=1 Tax=Sphingobacterium haloxyli TaxID=2100533 RepID=A0A2S9J032_9SPHI|nr:DNA/RNA helicase domain-containing protein [Sphingobacterium haloxyli]PRD46100.1 hypothetical protein C5745_16890 [Sphingobacterium haloxyli]